MKYVMALLKHRKDPTYSRYVPLIFPDPLVHAVMAENLTHALYQQVDTEVYAVRIVSAGSINDQWECYGKSESLRLDSHPDDTDIVRTYGYFHGLNFPERP